jgi:AraC family transcriptional regulator, transcriptional activator of pobA
MARTSIPVHHLPAHDHGAVTVERFERRSAAVRNEVHRHDFHEIFFIAEGSGQHMIDLESHDFSAPCLHAIAPGQVHRLSRSGDSSGRVVMFLREAVDANASEQDVRQLFGPWNARPIRTITPEQLNEANTLLDLIANEARLGGSATQRILGSLLSVLLAKAAVWVRSARTDHEDMGQERSGAEPDIVRRFLADVETGFLSERRVSSYAERYAISADHLSDLLRERIGKSAMDVLQDRLVLEAKRLLLHSAMSVKEVGFALNLEDPAYFSRVFKKATGHSPGEYREHVREVYKS